MRSKYFHFYTEDMPAEFKFKEGPENDIAAIEWLEANAAKGFSDVQYVELVQAQPKSYAIMRILPYQEPKDY